MKYYQCQKYPIEFVLSENLDKQFEAHNHVGHYVISLVMQGVVTVCLENREVMCRRGEAFIIPPYVVHAVRQRKDARLLSMCIETALIEETDINTAEDIFREALGGAVRQGIFGRKQKEKLYSCVQSVYRSLTKDPKEMDVDIKTLRDQIVDYPEQDLSIEALAAHIYVSKYYLIRKFKNCIGMTPHRFRIQNRIRKSQGLLDAERTVGEISAEMGFYDQSHFDRAFRKIVGISPSEYVQSKRQIEQGA